MSFHTIIRIQGHPARADQSALCAINRHLLVARFICQSTSSAVSARDFSWYVSLAALLLLNNDRQVHSLMDLTIDVIGACSAKWSDLRAAAIDLHVVDARGTWLAGGFGDAILPGTVRQDV